MRISDWSSDVCSSDLFQYFVAIEDGVGNITAKELFDIRAPFEGNIRRVARFEELELRIQSPPQGFRQTLVLIGFPLTPEHPEPNRRHTQSVVSRTMCGRSLTVGQNGTPTERTHPKQ